MSLRRLLRTYKIDEVVIKIYEDSHVGITYSAIVSKYITESTSKSICKTHFRRSSNAEKWADKKAKELLAG